MLRFIYRQTNKLLIDFIDKESEGMNIKVEDKKFMADFYKYGFVEILQEWIEDGMKEEPEKIIKKLNDIIEGDFKKSTRKKNAKLNLYKNIKMSKNYTYLNTCILKIIKNIFIIFQ